MAFWNKKRKQREQEALERGMQETLDAIREKKKAMGLPLSKEEEKEEERVARGHDRINLLTIMGLVSGSNTDPPALAYANNSTGNDQPAVAYSTVYPLTMFLRVVAAQVLILCLA